MIKDKAIRACLLNSLKRTNRQVGLVDWYLLRRSPLVLILLIMLLGQNFADTEQPHVGNTQLGLQLSTDSLNFGHVKPGNISQETVNLHHVGDSGTDPIEIIGISTDELDSQYFSTDFSGPITLYPGESFPLTVYYAPTIISDKKKTIVGSIFVSHQGESNVIVLSVQAEGLSNSELSLQNRAIGNPGFIKSQLDGIGAIRPTTLQFGPDGRLYVADMLGAVKIYSVQRIKSNQYVVISTESLNHIKNIANHNDDGSLNPSINTRLITGLLVSGTSDKPVIFVASSDPRIGGGPSHNDSNLDTNSSMISRLSWNGSQWDKLDLVRGLPRSEENHAGNGMTISNNGQFLYLAMGGNTNAGATSYNFALLPEYALSAAILQIDLSLIGDETYDIPTLNDEDRAGVNDHNDPFGGNQGKNQAKLLPNGPIKVYAPGFRNPYDVVITEAGRMYSVDNGPNAGWGGIPVNEGTQGQCTNGLNEPGHSAHDSLHFITGYGYYGGHANPTRGNSKNTFNTSNPQSPVFTSNQVECDYRMPGSENGSLVTFPDSTNGLVEYTATNFNGAMKGDLLAAGFSNKLYRIQLNSSGTKVLKRSDLFSNIGAVPLDVTTQSDFEIYPGTIWVADFSGQSIYVFEPSDYDGDIQVQCNPDVPSGDADNDGFNNQDEIANNTDPCSAADLPADFDGDKVSDLIDSDDDNDGINDLDDPFAMDANNGAGSDFPFSYDWENDSQAAGGILNLGFTGLMSNGVDDYAMLFDPNQLTASGAAGVLTIDNVNNGDAFTGHNSQHYGFQLGVNVSLASPVFTVHTRILAPFAGISPTPGQAMGLFIGNGDQDNYIKLTANATGSTGGIQLLKETHGGNIVAKQVVADVFGADFVDLFLKVDPGNLTVKASYQVSLDGNAGVLTTLPETLSIPAIWLNGPTKLAAGILSTAAGGSPFAGTCLK